MSRECIVFATARSAAHIRDAFMGFLCQNAGGAERIADVSNEKFHFMVGRIAAIGQYD